MNCPRGVLTPTRPSCRLAARRGCSLEPSQKCDNHRYKQEQEKGFQDPHNPRVIIHPIRQQSPHGDLRLDHARAELGKDDEDQSCDHSASVAAGISSETLQSSTATLLDLVQSGLPET